MKVFLAGPFTFKIKNNSLTNENTVLIQKLIKSLREKGHTVFNAHEREKYGSDLFPPRKATTLDFEQIKQSDILIAYPGYPPSGGTHIELGWASCMGKKIVLLLKKSCNYSPLVYGLSTITEVNTIEFEKKSELIEKVSDFIDTIDKVGHS